MAGALANQLEFEAWRDTLRSYCGNFDVTPGPDISTRHGAFAKRMLGGLTAANDGDETKSAVVPSLLVEGLTVAGG